jgi:hypothetical protein
MRLHVRMHSRSRLPDADLTNFRLDKIVSAVFGHTSGCMKNNYTKKDGASTTPSSLIEVSCKMESDDYGQGCR